MRNREHNKWSQILTSDGGCFGVDGRCQWHRLYEFERKEGGEQEMVLCKTARVVSQTREV